MNTKNTNLHKAKKEANDEFYTQYEDIAKEIEHYKEHLKGKVVYCNCDIPYFSNFHKYFLDNFKELELKQVIIICGFFTIINRTFTIPILNISCDD